MRYVLDSSVALRWLIQEEQQENADMVLTRVHPRAGFAYDEAILRYPMTPEIARKAGRYVPLRVSGCDACYAALAEELEAQWLIFDRKAHQLLADKEISVNLWEGVPAGW